jgi:hypothetical protein
LSASGDLLLFECSNAVGIPMNWKVERKKGIKGIKRRKTNWKKEGRKEREKDR